MHPPGGPAGASPGPSGTLLAPKQPPNNTCRQGIFATKRQEHEPRRQMHGNLENIVKANAFSALCALPAAPLEPPGALLAPKPPSNNTCWQGVCAIKRKKHDPAREMHGKPENTIKADEFSSVCTLQAARWSLAKHIWDPHGALPAPTPPSSSTCWQDIFAKGRPRAIQRRPRDSHCAH